MSLEEFDRWDTDFLEDAIRAEEEAISKSSRNPTQFPPPPSFPPISVSSSYFPINNNNNNTNIDSFSPPRELSQKPSTKSNSNIILLEQQEEQEETEIVRLKRELGRVSKQLTDLEQEFTDLKKDRDNKEEQLKHVTSQIAAKDDCNHRAKNVHMEYETATQERSPIDLWVGSEYLLSEANKATGTSMARGRPTEKLSCNNKSVLERVEIPSVNHPSREKYDKMRKNDCQFGVSVRSDYREHTLVDNALSTANECFVKKTSLLKTTAQPKCTDVGVQTDTSDYLPTIDKDLLSQQALSSELLAIWGSLSGQILGRDLVSKILRTCAADFYVLFRCMSTSVPSKITLDSLAEESFKDVALHEKVHSVQSIEAAKVSNLYMMLTKINNGVVKLGTFFEALLELCTVENVVVVHRSLRIVREILQHILSLGSRSGKRDNVKIEGICPNDELLQSRGSGRACTGIQFDMICKETSILSGESNMTSFDLDTIGNKKAGDPGWDTSSFSPDWGSLIQIMNQIAMGNVEEQIQVEAISIMNLILMRSHLCLEREKYGQKLLYESIPRLLQKEVGMAVQKQAVRLLFLLLNCPKLLAMFSSSKAATDGAAAAGTESATASADDEGFRSILMGLADCIQCKENGVEALGLRRHAITVLAFVASSGKFGFEVLLNLETCKRINFLGLILRALSREMDAEAAELTDPPDIRRERISLMREALILLNRLASSPIYSATVLGILTSSREMASLTTDVANRMAKRGRTSCISTITSKSKLEAEIIELALVFRSRFHSYLGDTIS